MKTIRALCLFLLAVSLLAGCSNTANKLTIDIDPGPNPWIHLNFNNNHGNLQFAVIADRTGANRPGIFTQAIEKLNQLQPEFVMSIGDLIEGYTEDTQELTSQWDELDGMVQQLHMPFFYVAGNHDITNQTMLDIWNQRLGKTYYHFVYKDVLFLCLNTEDPPQGSNYVYISDEQMKYFENVLAQHPDVRWTFLFQHKPSWHELYGRNDTSLPKFQSMLAGRDYTIFAGHHHAYQKSTINSQDHYILATTVRLCSSATASYSLTRGNLLPLRVVNKNNHH